MVSNYGLAGLAVMKHNDGLTKFTVMEHHLKLLGRLNVGWNMYAYDGAPFGNEDVVGDIYEIVLGRRWDVDELGDMPDEIYDLLMTIFYEMDYVLLIVALETSRGQLVKAGDKFRKAHPHSYASWERVTENA
jgi:hypothetical protein